MSLHISDRASLPRATQSRMISFKSHVQRALAGLFAESVVGNPLHEAWTADGEPVERLTPADLARARQSRFAGAINGHSR